MIIVTGGAGFIGSNLVKGLNNIGCEDIIVVDDLTDGIKFRNLVETNIADYWDIEQLRDFIKEGRKVPFKIDAIFHQGACSDTTEWNGRFMMDNNFTYSKLLLLFSIENNIPFIYASSAAVYGVGTEFLEDPANEAPVNMYGYSKYLFDRYVIKNLSAYKSQVVGLRYFNVYGPGEKHKGQMASVAFHLNNQLVESGKLKLFKGSDGYTDGDQRRDFVYIDDVINVNLWMLENKNVTGVFNTGTGISRSFNDVANLIIKWHGKGEIEYIEFPEQLKNCYQSFTQAELKKLMSTGYNKEFTMLENGIKQYLEVLNK